MGNYGYNKKERDLIITEIEEWMKDFPFGYDWTELDVKINDEPFTWKRGDIIDVQNDHLKIFDSKYNAKTDAKREAGYICGDFYGKTGDYIVYSYKYFPEPKHPLEIKYSTWEMKIISYEGALRIYKQLSGKKFPGFEDYGKEIYY